MKKLYILLTIIALLILGGCTYFDSLEERIRIIGNSDIPEDIEKKYKIREALLEIFYEENLEVNSQNISKLEQRLRTKTQHLNVDFTVEFRNVTFPAKMQNGKFIPSGTYKTLLITIGEGKGSNWWSVLYPEFFGLNYDDSGEIEYRSFIYDLLKNE